MAGYSGYKMSNNAIQAYEEGEKPFSKWRKGEIIELLEYEVSPGILKLFKKIPVKQLKEEFLSKTSWHHTSKKYNKTDFYSVNIEKASKISEIEIEKIITSSKTETVQVEDEKWECIFLEWSGSRKHPKAEEVKEIGIIKGNWFYRKNGSKKSINATGFKKIKRV